MHVGNIEMTLNPSKSCNNRRKNNYTKLYTGYEQVATIFVIYFSMHKVRKKIISLKQQNIRSSNCWQLAIGRCVAHTDNTHRMNFMSEWYKNELVPAKMVMCKTLHIPVNRVFLGVFSTPIGSSWWCQTIKQVSTYSLHP